MFFALVLIFALAGFGCSNDLKTIEVAEGKGEIAVAVSTSPITKTIWPSGWADSIDSFTVTLHKDGHQIGDEVVIMAGSEEPNHVFENIDPGDHYEILVVAKDDSDNILGQGDVDDISVLPLEKTPVIITVYPTLEAGDGSFSITLEWPDNLTRPVNKVDADRKMVGEVDWNDDETWHPLSGIYSGTYDKDPAEAGSHIVRFKLYDDEDALISTVIEVVNVYSNFHTEGTITLTKDDFYPDPDDFETVVGELGNNQAQFAFRNHNDMGTVYLAGTFNGWNHPIPDEVVFESPRADYIVHSAIVDNKIEFEIWNNDDFTSPWDFTSWAITVPYTTGTLTGTDVTLGEGGRKVVISNLKSEDAIVIHIDVAGNKINIYHDDRSGGIDMEIEVDEGFVHYDNFEIRWLNDGAGNRVFYPTGHPGGPNSYFWMMNGEDAGDEEQLIVPEGDLKIGDRIALVMEYFDVISISRQLTVTKEIIEGIMSGGEHYGEITYIDGIFNEFGGRSGHFAEGYYGHLGNLIQGDMEELASYENGNIYVIQQSMYNPDPGTQIIFPNGTPTGTAQVGLNPGDVRIFVMNPDMNCVHAYAEGRIEIYHIDFSHSGMVDFAHHDGQNLNLYRPQQWMITDMFPEGWSICPEV